MDQQLLFLINRTWAHPSLDLVMAAASSWAVWWPILIVVLALCLWRGGFRVRAMIVTAALAVGITDGLVVNNLKDTVGRPRPHDILEGVRTIDLAKAKPRILALGQPVTQSYSVARIRTAHGNSFPSGHACNNFAVAAVCFAFYRRWGWLAFLPAFLVGYSRVYVGSHWPLDILVSMLIGTGLGFLTVVLADFLWRRLGRRLPWSAAHPTLLSA